MKNLFLSLLIVTGFYVSAHKPAKVMNDVSGWRSFAGQMVSIKSSHSHIVVSGPAKFESIKFKTDGRAQITCAVIWFDNGEMQEISFVPDKKGDYETRPVSLSPGYRDIRSIVLEYKSPGKKDKEKVRIEVLGFVPEFEIAKR
jgi:hypothetical protein